MRNPILLRSLACGLLLLAGACNTVSTRPRPLRAAPPAPAGEGLFAADSAVLGDQDIARILDARWEVPPQVRLALLPLRSDSVVSRYGYAAPSPAAGMQTAFRAVDELLALPNVFDVSYLPEFLLGGERSLPVVREAAARYQADWVLLYSTSISTYHDSWVFARDEVKGQCIVECALLDTRTGLIPFTSRSSQVIDVEEDKAGEDLPVLLLRAEHEAVDAAMLENAKALTAFLEAAR